MISALENLCGPGGSLKREPPDAREFAGLLRSGKARLKDAGSADLALESRFDLAYNAAHALCLAALRWHGYRSGKRYMLSVHEESLCGPHWQAFARTVKHEPCRQGCRHVRRDRWS